MAIQHFIFRSRMVQSRKPRPTQGRGRAAWPIVLLVTLCVTSGCETAPPVQEMSDARQAIAVARKAGAESAAAYHLQAAENFLANAEEKLGERAYHQARRDAKQAKMKALDALKVTETAVETQK